MKTSFYITLLASLLIIGTTPADAQRGNNKRNASSGGKKGRVKTTRLGGNSVIESLSNSINNSDTTTTDEEETEEPVKKDVKTCEQIFYTCMDDKTNEAAMGNDSIYTDYSDMLAEIYAGMTSPAFKCIYSDDVKSLYSTYYYGYEISSTPSSEHVRGNSIEYYGYLKDNATQVASKRLPITSINSSVLEMLNLNAPIGGLDDAPETPFVSYKVNTIDTRALFKSNAEYCLNPENNEELVGCKIKKISPDKYKSYGITVSKSCEDYETFLADKLLHAKKDANDYIYTLRTKISSSIDELNLKKEAEAELKKLEAEEQMMKAKKATKKNNMFDNIFKTASGTATKY